MKDIIIPKNFNGAKFAKKFDIPNEPGDHNFYLIPRGDEHIIVCPSMPDLTESDLADCVGPEEEVPTIEEFLNAYIASEKGNKQMMKDLLERYERTGKR